MRQQSVLARGSLLSGSRQVKELHEWAADACRRAFSSTPLENRLKVHRVHLTRFALTEEETAPRPPLENARPDAPRAGPEEDWECASNEGDDGDARDDDAPTHDLSAFYLREEYAVPSGGSGSAVEPKRALKCLPATIAAAAVLRRVQKREAFRGPLQQQPR